jgi:hypothetical protein
LLEVQLHLVLQALAVTASAKCLDRHASTLHRPARRQIRVWSRSPSITETAPAFPEPLLLS